MANLIPLEEAAAILGITTEELTELRSNNEVFGYRDGASWKFKMSELERVAAERGLQMNLEDDSAELIGSDSGDLIQDDSSSEFGGDDELLLEGDDDLLLESSEDALGDEGALSFGESDLSFASGSNKNLGTGDLLDDEEPGGGSPSDTGKMGGSDIDQDDLLLSEEDLFSDELTLQDDGSFGDSSELSSDFEDSDLILEDSDSSSEIELRSADNELELSASESGVSIDDEPLELGGSDIDALELPEDDDMIVLDEFGDPDSETVMQEDNFSLTPLEVEPDEESSGSQVIALESSEIYADDSAETVLGGGSGDFIPGPQMLEEVSDMGGGAAGMMPGGMTGPMPTQMSAMPEAPFTLFQILSLAGVLLILLAGGAVAYDVARNMWSPEDSIISNSVLNFFLKMTGMNEFS